MLQPIMMLRKPRWVGRASPCKALPINFQTNHSFVLTNNFQSSIHMIGTFQIKPSNQQSPKFIKEIIDFTWLNNLQTIN